MVVYLDILYFCLLSLETYTCCSYITCLKLPLPSSLSLHYICQSTYTLKLPYTFFHAYLHASLFQICRHLESEFRWTVVLTALVSAVFHDLKPCLTCSTYMLSKYILNEQMKLMSERKPKRNPKFNDFPSKTFLLL